MGNNSIEYGQLINLEMCSRASDERSIRRAAAATSYVAHQSSSITDEISDCELSSLITRAPLIITGEVAPRTEANQSGGEGEM